MFVNTVRLYIHVHEDVAFRIDACNMSSNGRQNASLNRFGTPKNNKAHGDNA
jgi:hypothetical protein